MKEILLSRSTTTFVPRPMIEVNGAALRLKDIATLVESDTMAVAITEASRAAVLATRRFLEGAMRERIIYGVNTGFGPMASHIIGQGELARLQKNLIRSHAVGMGEPVEGRYVLAAMAIRLNTLAKGFSGVTADFLECLAAFINKRILPIVPKHGAVGTSGDLVQLAHIGLAMMGEGAVLYRGEARRSHEVLQELAIEPYEFKAKEGLALINGTSFMAGAGAVICLEAERAIEASLRLGAMGLEVARAFEDYLAKQLHECRPHEGQRFVAKRLRVILESSRRIRPRDALPRIENGQEAPYAIDEEVQSVYSLRCIPQIMGPVVEAWRRARDVLEIEMNSVTDNPIVDAERGVILHGGNFHGEVVAGALDDLKARLVKATLLSERRINFFLNRGVNRRFPHFLNVRQPGLTLGLQGLQFVATSVAARSQSLAFPHAVHSIPTNADNQDVVSMGADAALITAEVVENFYTVLAIETIVLSQAAECEGERDDLSLSSQRILAEMQNTLPPIYEDRDISEELPAVVRLLKTGECFEVTTG